MATAVTGPNGRRLRAAAKLAGDEWELEASDAEFEGDGEAAEVTGTEGKQKKRRELPLTCWPSPRGRR